MLVLLVVSPVPLLGLVCAVSAVAQEESQRLKCTGALCVAGAKLQAQRLVTLVA